MKKISTLSLALGLAAMTACGTGSSSVTTSMSGTRSGVATAPAFVTAAKPDAGDNNGGGQTDTSDAAITEAVSAVTLAVEKIMVHRADEGDANAKEGSEKDGDSGWEQLVGTPQEIDLIQAASEPTSATLGTADLPEGKYTQIRLYLKETGNTITVAGVDHPLTVPSGALKLVGNAMVEADKQYKLEIRFDLDKSLVVNAQGYKLKPTVKYSLVEQ